MTPAPVFDRAYTLVKHRLRSGAWRPGQRLELPVLAADLDASLTPLRDALHRLVGEGLLTWGPSEGFAVPDMTELDLRDLYGFHLDLTLLSVRSRRSSSPMQAAQSAQSEDPVSAICALFESLGAGSDNREHTAAIRAVGDRLHPARLVEGRSLLDLRGECRDMWSAASGGDVRHLRVLLNAYHRRRMRAAGQIAHHLYRPDAAE
jgi:hypothetical protein